MQESAMAMGGRSVVFAALTAACGFFAAETGRADQGYVVMPHPNACRCCNEEPGFCEGLWEKLRPGHRDRYLARQHSRHLHHPECPPWCMENYGHYQTCWRPFPEHTLGCRNCYGSSVPPLAAPPIATPATPAPYLAAPPAPAVQTPAEVTPMPPAAPRPLDEYDPPAAPATENPVDQTAAEYEIEPQFSRFSDPAWQAGLRPASAVWTER